MMARRQQSKKERDRDPTKNEGKIKKEEGNLLPSS